MDYMKRKGPEATKIVVMENVTKANSIYLSIYFVQFAYIVVRR
jgi:hypothetical protein